MTSSLLLSFAIPTYNRSGTLRRTLDSILSQLSADSPVEIVVSDNASPDDTPALLRQYAERFPQLRFSRNEVNRGLDYNTFKAIDDSRGEYVHLLSDDDFLLPGAVNKILGLVRSRPEVSFFYLNGRGFNLDEAGHPRFFPRPVIWDADDVLYANKDDFLGFLKLQATFMSAFLFRREQWNRDGTGQQFIGSDIYLSFELVRLLAATRYYLYCAEPLVAVEAVYSPGNYRIFNAFAYQWRRLLLGEAVRLGFSRPRMKEIFRSSLGHLAPKLASIKMGEVRQDLNLDTVRMIVVSTYDTRIFWFRLLPILLAPGFALRALRTLRRRWRGGYADADGLPVAQGSGPRQKRADPPATVRSR
jgi:glycosyltransferase involved in cell wall biosynthesis